MSKNAKKTKKEDEIRLLEEKALFEDRLAADRRLYRLCESTDHPRWIEFVTVHNLALLGRQTVGAHHSFSFLMFVRMFEAGLTHLMTFAEFRLAALVADSVFGWYRERGTEDEQVTFAVNFYLNEVLGLAAGSWTAVLRGANVQTNPDKLFEDWREERFRLVQEKLDHGTLAPLFSAGEDAEGVWAEPGSPNALAIDWQDIANDSFMVRQQVQIEKQIGREFGVRLAEDFPRLFGDFTALFRAYQELPPQEFVTEEVKTVEPPKAVARDSPEQLLRPLQALNAAQNGKNGISTSRSQPRPATTAVVNAVEALKPTELDEEAVAWIRQEVERTRERLQAELDAKTVEAGNKRGKK